MKGVYLEPCLVWFLFLVQFLQHVRSALCFASLVLFCSAFWCPVLVWYAHEGTEISLLKLLRQYETWAIALQAWNPCLFLTRFASVNVGGEGSSRFTVSTYCAEPVNPETESFLLYARQSSVEHAAETMAKTKSNQTRHDLYKVPDSCNLNRVDLLSPNAGLQELGVNKIQPLGWDLMPSIRIQQDL